MSEEEDGDKPLPQTRQASAIPYYYYQSVPVPGLYENYDPPNMNITGDQGRHVDIYGRNQDQGHPSQHQAQQGNFQYYHTPHMPGGYYGPPFGYPYPTHPTQAGANGDANVQGQEFAIRPQKETFSKDYFDGDTDMSLEEPRPTKIIVTGLPSTVHDDFLQMFFEKKTGSEPISVERYEDDEENEAIIEFKSPDAVDKVMQHRPIKMLGVVVDVEMYIPEPDEPLCTIVVEGPASLMEEDILELHFENKRKCGGDTIVDIQIDENHVAYITYESEEVAQRVVDKGKHTMENKELCVRLHVPEKKTTTKRHLSQASTDRDSEPENLEPVRTIEVRGPLSVLNEELLELYFENKKKAGGGPIEKIEVYEDMAHITFETEEAAERVANKQGHKINKLAITVELYCHEEEEQDPPRTIKVAGMRHVKSRETVEIYFKNKRRADGGPIEGTLQVDNDDDNVAYITFESHEVAHAVANRSHSVDNCDLEVSLHVPGKSKKGKQTSKWFEEEIPEPTKTVKVKGMTKMKSTSTLEYYFENKRRSGGGNHTMEICEEDEDIAYFTFETHEVAKAVSERSHCIEKIELNVCLYTKPKPPPQYDDRVFIKGVKSTTTNNCLFNFLEAKSGCTPQSLVHGEKEGDILVVFESCPDFDKLDHISKNISLEGASLKMSRVAESNCVLVSDIPSYTTRDTIQFYFENQRRSGGGPVLKVDVNQEEDTMIVFFEDYKVAEAVSNRSHKIGEATIKCDLYLPCIGRPQGDGNEARFKTPKPMVITDHTQRLKQGLATVNAKKEDQNNEVPGRKRHVLTDKEETDSDEIFEQFCDPCKDENNDVIAEGYCIDCSEYLCGGCYTQHKRPRPFRNHILQGKTEMPKYRPAVKNSTDSSVCDKHGEEIKFYCNSHAQPGCGACATFEHKLCKNVLYLESEYKEIQKKCDIIGQSLDENTKKKNLNMHCIDEQFSNSSTKIAHFRKEINDFFDKLETVKNSQAIEIKSKDRISMEKKSIEFGQIKDELKSLQHELKELYKSKQNLGLFSAMYKANGKLHQLSNKLNELSKHNKISKCQFIPEKKIKDMMKEVEEIGKLYF